MNPTSPTLASLNIEVSEAFDSNPLLQARLQPVQRFLRSGSLLTEFCMTLSEDAKVIWRCSTPDFEAEAAASIHAKFDEGLHNYQLELQLAGKQAEHLAEFFKSMLKEIMEQGRLIAQEQELLNEVRDSWECLDAFYSMFNSIGDGNSAQYGVDMAIERLVRLSPGMAGVLWLANGSVLEQSVVRGVQRHQLSETPIANGLAYRCFREQKPIQIDDHHQLKQLMVVEPELSSAQSVLTLPLICGDHCHGVLTVWHDSEIELFEARNSRLVSAFVEQLTMVLENQRLHEHALETERLQHDIEIGAEIQAMLLDCEIPPILRDLKLTHRMIASAGIDGDFIEYFYHDDRWFDVVIADVMGKGVPAALLGAATKNTILRCVNQLMRESGVEEPMGLDEIVNFVREEEAPRLAEMEKFVTMCYARFDTELRELSFVDCGHTKTIHFQQRRRLTVKLEGENLPLGMRVDEEYRSRTIRYEAGDVFVFYSDGITEANNSAGEMYGPGRLMRLLERLVIAGENDPNRLADRILADVRSFMGERPAQDDITCVVVCVPHDLPKAVVQHEARSSFPGVVDSLPAFRSFIEDAISHCGEQGSKWQDEFIIAAHEAASNIIVHGLNQTAERSYRIAIDVLSNSVEVRFQYDGKKFATPLLLKPDLTGTRDGGFGLYIIDQSADYTIYTQSPSGEDVLILIKEFNSQD